MSAARDEGRGLERSKVEGDIEAQEARPERAHGRGAYAHEEPKELGGEREAQDLGALDE
jgi:hypothetical protein